MVSLGEPRIALMSNAQRQPGVQSVNALRRGLSVLRAVETAVAASFTELQRETALPKATLARALKTLAETGWIQLDLDNARYSLNPVPIACTSSLGWKDCVAEAAATPRAVLQLRVPWPNDLGVRDGPSMLSIDGPHARNSLSANFKVLGSRPSMLRSSLGRCYMSFCAEDEREEILQTLRKSRSAADREGSETHEIKRMVEQVRRQGYATRNAKYTSGDSPERFGALAVPILLDGRAPAALCVVWIPAVVDEKKIIHDYLKELQTAARAIAVRLKASAALKS